MPHPLERPATGGEQPTCLQCEKEMPPHDDTPAHGWLVGVFYRRAAVRKAKSRVRGQEDAHDHFEVALCPEHGLYTASRQSTLGMLNPNAIAEVKPIMPQRFYPLNNAICAHCKAQMQLDLAEDVTIDVILSPGWGFARLQRWTDTKIFNIAFWICDKHTLCGGQRDLKPKKDPLGHDPLGLNPLSQKAKAKA